MLFYAVEPYFWVKLIVLLVGVWFVIDVFNRIMSKLFKVNRKKSFFVEQVNKQHRKIDWIIRILFILLIVIGYFVNSLRHPQEPLVFLEPYVLLFSLIFVTEILTIVMEWKYAPNPKAYVVTLTQLLFIIVLIIILFMTDFFWLFK